MRTQRYLRARVERQINHTRVAVAKDIRDTLTRKGLTQAAASHVTGEAPSQLSLICTGKLRGFSLERLIRTRALLGAAVQIVVSRHGGTGVSAHVAG